MSADVIPINPPDPDPEPTEPAGRLELITVVGYGGLPLQRMLAVVDEHDQILMGSAVQLATEEQALATWQRVCEIMADAFDDETGTYFLERRRVDEQGRPVPSAAP